MAKVGSHYQQCDDCGRMFMPSKHEHCPHCQADEAGLPLGEQFNPNGFEGYWFKDSEGRLCHTWDYEESIGE